MRPVRLSGAHLSTQAIAEAGIDAPISPHRLRHVHGSHAIDRGATLPEVQQTLGHANISATIHAGEFERGSSSIPECSFDEDDLV
jgi:site-specific recombinase XerC